MYHVKRKNATDKSFEQQNAPYLSHPTSSVTSQQYEKIDKTFQKRLEESKDVFNQEITAEVMKSSHQFRQPYTSQPTSQIAFLTKEELEVANENAQRRVVEILDSKPVSSTVRPDISQDVENDSGLAWLYDSSITFVDCSKDVSDQVCSLHHFLL